MAKKVLLITRPIVPPWDEASKNFAYYLARTIKSFDIALLTNGQLPDLPANIRQLPIYSNNRLSLLQKGRLLKLYSRWNQFDIIHYMLTPNRLNSYTAKLLQAKRSTKTIQTIATLRDDYYGAKVFRRILFADLLVTYSNLAKQKLLQMGFKNVEHIYPGIDLEYFKPAAKNLSMAQSHGVKNTDFVVTYPGEYNRLGATDDLVALLPELVKSIPNVKLVFACRVKHRAAADKKRAVVNAIAALGLTKYVVYTDTIDDMASLYNLSDLVLFPVRNMAGKFDVPLAVIEAMACAKPVIISDLPVLSEFAVEGSSITIPVGDNDALLTKIKQLYKTPKLSSQVGLKARSYAKQNFDIIRIASQYEKAYNALLKP